MQTNKLLALRDRLLVFLAVSRSCLGLKVGLNAGVLGVEVRQILRRESGQEAEITMM